MNRVRAYSSGGGSGVQTFNVMWAGQSLAEYYDLRGTPRVGQFIAELLQSTMGLGGGAVTIYNTVPYVNSDSTTKTERDYNIRTVNSASGGSALLDTSSGGSQIATGNYWYNTQNNSATSPDGALDATPNTPGPLWRDMIANIGIYGIDAFVWSQGQTDLGANMTTYESVIGDLFDAVRTSAYKATLPIIILHIKDGNVASEANTEALVKVQSNLAETMSNVHLVQEYASEFAINGSIAACTFTTASKVISTINTGSLSVNQKVSGAGIPDSCYIDSISAGVSFTVNQFPTSNQTNITLYSYDNTHPYPGADGTEPLTENGGTEHLTTKGFYEIGRRWASAMKRIVNQGETRKIFGPEISAISPALGSYTFNATVSHDQGSTLTKYDTTAIDSTSGAIMRVENAGVSMGISNVNLTTPTNLQITLSAPVTAGTFKFWPAYGAMNRSKLNNIIMDNASVRMPLARKNPDVYSELTATVSAHSRQSLQAAGAGNLIAQWDFTLSSSYSGSGTTLTNIATPANGDTASAYNLTMAGLTFSGSANSAAAYVETAGAGYAEISANTAFLNSLHKTTGGSDYAIVAAYYVTATTSCTLFSTLNTTSLQGISLESSTNVVHRQRGDSAATNVSGGTVSTGTWYLLIVTHDHTNNLSYRWINTRTGTSQSHAFNTTTTDATVNMHLLARNDSTSYLPSGGRFKGAALFNTKIDDGYASFLLDYYRTLHGEAYT